MWKVLWAAVLCCLVLSKWRSINEVTAYQKQYFSEFTVKFSVWKLEWCLCAGVTVGVVVVFCRQIHEKRKTGHLWDAPRFKAQRPSWSSLLRCLCCGRVIWHRALNKWWHTQSRLKCGVWENLFLLNMKRSSEIIYLEINTLKEILRIRAAVLGVLASESNHLHSVFTGNF